MGYREVIRTFKERYAHYFHTIYEVVIPKGWLTKHMKSDRAKLLYSFYLHFCKDAFFRPYRRRDVRLPFRIVYDKILSFSPPLLTGCLPVIYEF